MKADQAPKTEIFKLIREPDKPFSPGSDREAAWAVARAFNGCRVSDVVAAWTLMEQSRGSGTNPRGWLTFFCGPSARSNSSGTAPLAQIESSEEPIVTPNKAAPTWGVGEDSKTVWALARDVFGDDDVSAKLALHLKHLKDILRDR
jgi:hypothetical protein